MNQAQRNFLIKKIEEKVKITIDALDSAKRADMPPSISAFLLHEVLSGRFEIKTQEQIKEIIKQKALKTNDRDDWMGNSWGTASKDSIVFKAVDFFVLPEHYQRQWDEFRVRQQELQTEISNIRIQSETIITRIQLASDKVLQTMINEVDDMGNLSLMDTKLKLLS